MDTRGPAPPQQQPVEPRSPFDQALAVALRDVPIPDGLKDRLLLAVSQAASAPPAGLVEPLGKAAPSGDTEPAFAATDEGVQAEASQLEPGKLEAGRAPRWKRRAARWLASAMAATAAAALLCWVGGPRIWSVAKPTPDDLLALAREQMPQDLGAMAGWQDINNQPSGDQPMTFQHVRKQRIARWRYCRLRGVKGVLFDVSQPGVKGALYVVPLEKLSVPSQALPPRPGRPVFTQGRTSSIWRERNYLCLLIVEGDEQALRRLLKQPTPVAYRRPHVHMLAGSSAASHEERSSAGGQGGLRPAARREPGRSVVPTALPRGRRPG